MQVIIAILLMVGLSGCEKLDEWLGNDTIAPLLGKKPSAEKTPEWVCAHVPQRFIDHTKEFDKTGCAEREKVWRGIAVEQWDKISFGMRVSPNKWYSFQTLVCDTPSIQTDERKNCP